MVTFNSNSVMADDVIARARVAPYTLHPQDEKSVMQRMRFSGPKEVISSQEAFDAPVIDDVDGGEYRDGLDPIGKFLEVRLAFIRDL